jgi:anti-anti-sigma regulatory factor
MMKKRQALEDEFRVTVTEEAALVRFGLAGKASMREAKEIRRICESYAACNLPMLIVDDGLTFVDTVSYGALVQWAQSVRNRNVGWVMTTSLGTAGRMFQMGNLSPEEVLHTSEDAARKALDRGRAGHRVSTSAGGILALDGLRLK